MSRIGVSGRKHVCMGIDALFHPPVHPLRRVNTLLESPLLSRLNGPALTGRSDRLLNGVPDSASPLHRRGRRSVLLAGHHVEQAPDGSVDGRIRAVGSATRGRGAPSPETIPDGHRVVEKHNIVIADEFKNDQDSRRSCNADARARRATSAPAVEHAAEENAPARRPAGRRRPSPSRN